MKKNQYEKGHSKTRDARGATRLSLTPRLSKIPLKCAFYLLSKATELLYTAMKDCVDNVVCQLLLIRTNRASIVVGARRKFPKGRRLFTPPHFPLAFFILSFIKFSQLKVRLCICTHDVFRIKNDKHNQRQLYMPNLLEACGHPCNGSEN